MEREVNRVSNSIGKFHVAVTATDAAHSHCSACWVMYYWCTKFEDEPGSVMGGITRVLHFVRADRLMKEIPTRMVDPLSNGLDQVTTCMDFHGFSFLGCHRGWYEI
ncbi:hypothetical protein Ancab_000193 [Ancistrocladus abbreviatus]